MPDFVTVKEAQTLTSKSLSTILRYIRKNKDDHSIVKSSLVGGHWQYEVNIDVLRAKYGKSDQSSDSQEGSKDARSTRQYSPSPGNDELLRSIVETLQKQLEEKDKTIQALINNNHQLSGALAQMQLPAPGKKEEKTETGEIVPGSEEDEEKHAPKMTNEASQNKETGKSSSKERKKKGVIERIFNHKLF